MGAVVKVTQKRAFEIVFQEPAFSWALCVTSRHLEGKGDVDLRSERWVNTPSSAQTCLSLLFRFNLKVIFSKNPLNCYTWHQPHFCHSYMLFPYQLSKSEKNYLAYLFPCLLLVFLTNKHKIEEDRDTTGSGVGKFFPKESNKYFKLCEPHIGLLHILFFVCFHNALKL